MNIKFVPFFLILCISAPCSGSETQNLSTRNSQQATILYSKGNDYYKNKEYDKAMYSYTEALKLDPKFAKAYNNRGLVYHSQKRDYFRAIDDFEKAIQYSPDYAKAYYNLGNSYLSTKQYAKAVKNMEKSIQLGINVSAAMCGIGDVYLQREQYTTAIKYYDEVINLDPKYDYAYKNRGNAYYRLGDFNTALNNYLKAIEINPKFESAYYNCGLIYKDRQEYDTAIKYFSKAIENCPDYSFAFFQRSQVYKILGKHGLAAKDLSQATRINPLLCFTYVYHFIDFLLLLAVACFIFSMNRFSKRMSPTDPEVIDIYEKSKKNLLFFPFGASGSGIILTDEKSKNTLKILTEKAQSKGLAYTIACFLFILALLTLSSRNIFLVKAALSRLFAVVLIPFAIIAYRIYIKRASEKIIENFSPFSKILGEYYYFEKLKELNIWKTCLAILCVLSFFLLILYSLILKLTGHNDSYFNMIFYCTFILTLFFSSPLIKLLIVKSKQKQFEKKHISLENKIIS